MQVERNRQALAAFQAFLSTPLDVVLNQHTDTLPEQSVLELVQTVAASVPAYRAFLAEHSIDPATIQTFGDFQKLPQTNKKNYQLRYPLAELCRDGRLESCDFIAVSSGSTGKPTFWPRFIADELSIARWQWSASA